MIIGYGAISELGLVTHATRPTVFVWPPVTLHPIDTGIPLLHLHDPSVRRCIHKVDTVGKLNEPLELEPYGFSKAWLDLPPSSTIPLGTSVYVRPASSLEEADCPVTLADGVALIESCQLDDSRQGCWVELYNSAPTCAVLSSDLFIGRIRPLAVTCSESCSSVPVDYEDPSSRSTGGPFTMDSDMYSALGTSLAALHVID